MRHPKALVRRLWRAQLRLKVMAGVVVVTLVALVAFDVAAVNVMRRNLLGQTDANLQVALTLTEPMLARILRPPGSAVPRSLPASAGVQTPEGVKPAPNFVALAGAFNMVFLPSRGTQITLQEAAVGQKAGGRVVNWLLSPRAAKVALAPGPHTLAAQPGNTQIRTEAARVKGGSLIVGASLDQVDATMGQFELVVLFGSIASVLLIGFGVFLVLRGGLRPIETMAAQADRITAGDLTARVTPHSPRSEVGRLGTALNGMLARIEASVEEREASQEQMRRFFADASHELRTPLASLRANAELYQQGALGSPDQVDEVMRRITLETRRMGGSSTTCCAWRGSASIPASTASRSTSPP